MRQIDPSIDYRALLARSPDLICVVGPNGLVLDLNDAWEQSLGFSIEELQSTPLADLLHPDDRDRAPGAAGPLTGDARFRSKHGDYKRLSWSASRVSDSAPFLLVAREPAPPCPEERTFKAVVDGTSDFIGIVDLAGGNALYVNPAGMEMLGCTGQDYRTLNLDEYRTPASAARVEQEVIPAALRGSMWEGETEIRRADGTIIPVSQVLFTLRDAAGTPEALVTITRDISELKRYELELRQFKSLVESTTDFVRISDLQGGTIYLNKAGLAMVGRAGQDYRTLSAGDFIDSASFTPIGSGVRDHGVWLGETDLIHADGRKVPVSCVVTLIHDEAGAPQAYASIARDTSIHRRMSELEEELHVLSTPILEVWEGVLALPVLGRLNEARASRMMEALLAAIVQGRSRFAILDLTGLEGIDTSTAHHLLRMIAAVSLLGSRCVLSGISASIAQALIQLGVDMPAVRSFRSLREALRFATAPPERR